jgi:hypothetical protein
MNLSWVKVKDSTIDLILFTAITSMIVEIFCGRSDFCKGCGVTNVTVSMVVEIIKRKNFRVARYAAS